LIKNIVIVTGQHLVSNPRVWKEANALDKAGYRVTIFTTWYSRDLREKDLDLINDTVLYTSSCNLIKSESNLIQLLYWKIIRKLANYVFRFFKYGSVYQIAIRPLGQIEKITEFKSDLYICHQEVGLLLGVKLLDKGYKVAFDFEDWYSEDYLNRYRPIKLLREAELKAIQNGTYVTCASRSMSNMLSEKYQFDKQIQIIYNTFQEINESNKEQKKIPNSCVWFSQTIGSGRGLEPFLESIKNFHIPLEIHLIGNCTSAFKSYLDEYLQNTPHLLTLHPLMKHSDLMKFLGNFEFGLALENNFPKNKDLTISNKILTYLQLNLHVIATNTIGQLELKEDFKDSITYVDLTKPHETRNQLGKALYNLNRRSSLLFPDKYRWNDQQSKILSLVKDSVGT
jgi:hypothetical protein